jgi:hypothetical protein
MRAATGKAGKAGKAEKAHGKTSGFRSKDVSNTLLGVNLSSKYNVLSTKEIRLGRSELYDVVEIGGEGYKGPVRKAKIINDLVRYSRSKANYQVSFEAGNNNSKSPTLPFVLPFVNYQ